MNDQGATKNSGKFGWSPIKSPKQSENSDGKMDATSKTLPPAALKPDRSGTGLK